MFKIVVSRCLGLEACRYDGKMIDAPWLKELNMVAKVISVCPEVEIGLRVPRKPIDLMKSRDGLSVVQSETNTDLSEELVTFAQGYLRYIGKVDAFVLKSKSPSCGIGTTKIHQGDSFKLGSGVFAAQAIRLFPNAVFVDEEFLEKNGVSSLMDLITQR